MKFTVRHLGAEEVQLLGRRVALLWQLLTLMGQLDKRERDLDS